MSQPSKVRLFLLALLIVVMVSLILVLSRSLGGEPSFEVNRYLNSAQLMVGNTYTADVTIASQIADSASGKVILVREGSSNAPLVVVLPDMLGADIYPNQRYLADLSVGPNTQLTVVKIKKK